LITVPAFYKHITYSYREVISRRILQKQNESGSVRSIFWDTSGLCDFQK